MGKFTAVLSLLVFALVFTACGGDSSGYGKKKKKESGGPITGIMINAQKPDGTKPIKGTFDTWKVVDSSGVTIFSDQDINERFKSRKGVMWQWERAVALDRGRGLHLRTNFYEAIVEETVITKEGDLLDGTFRVSELTASELRALPNLGDLVDKAFILILVGKIGE